MLKHSEPPNPMKTARGASFAVDHRSARNAGDAVDRALAARQCATVHPPPRWTERALTVSELTRRVQATLEPAFQRVEVRGEVVGARPTSAGHLYFTLKDASSQLPCVFWRTSLARHPGKIEDGMKVVVAGDLQVYPAHGRYQLVAQRLVDIGMGELLAKLEALKAKLAAEGLFDPAKRRPLPLFPRRIGLVTAATGAALHDFVVTAHARFPVPIVLAACRVQGDLAAASIAGAIRVLARRPEIDVIVVGRGGGAMLDLLPFSDERVVRAIAASPVPIVSAVGHEIDTTLADLAADRRAATPTAAAELVVPRMSELVRALELQRAALAAATERLVAERRQDLDALDDRGRAAVQGRIERARRRLRTLSERLSRLHPQTRLGVMRVRWSRAETRLIDLVRRRLAAQRSALDLRLERLRLLSPLASLERGWALVRTDAGTLVRDAAEVQVGQALTVLVKGGSLEVVVTKATPVRDTPDDREGDRHRA